jgi:hypothetical protein
MTENKGTRKNSTVVKSLVAFATTFFLVLTLLFAQSTNAQLMPDLREMLAMQNDAVIEELRTNLGLEDNSTIGQIADRMERMAENVNNNLTEGTNLMNRFIDFTTVCSDRVKSDAENGGLAIFEILKPDSIGQKCLAVFSGFIQHMRELISEHRTIFDEENNDSFPVQY